VMGSQPGYARCSPAGTKRSRKKRKKIRGRLGLLFTDGRGKRCREGTTDVSKNGDGYVTDGRNRVLMRDGAFRGMRKKRESNRNHSQRRGLTGKGKKTRRYTLTIGRAQAQKITPIISARKKRQTRVGKKGDGTIMTHGRPAVKCILCRIDAETDFGEERARRGSWGRVREYT